MTTEPMTDTQRRMALRELAEWRKALPVAREVLAREEDELELLREAEGRVLADDEAVVAAAARLREAAGGSDDVYGTPVLPVVPGMRELVDRRDGLREPLQEARRAVSAGEARVAGRRRAIASVEGAVRERARRLGVMLEPGEADPPPAPPPPPPSPYTLWSPPYPGWPGPISEAGPSSTGTLRDRLDAVRERWG
jgi:hypothetical protein